jgi:hypothetical protein
MLADETLAVAHCSDSLTPLQSTRANLPAHAATRTNTPNAAKERNNKPYIAERFAALFQFFFSS